MKIGFLLGNLQGNGGIARVVSIIANELCKEHEIHIISFCPAIMPAGYEYDTRIICEQLLNDRVTMTTAILKKHIIGKLKKYIHIKQIDILIGCGELYFPLAILASAGKIKCYCWEHSDPAGTNDHKHQMFSRKMAVMFGTRIIVLTKAAETFYVESLHCKSSKITQIYNPIGGNVAHSIGYNEESKKILSVGRLTYQKNFQLLIKIASQILTKYPKWSWDICGEGEDREELEKLIKDYNLVNRIVLRGQIKNLYSEYGNYAFMVMTSRYEGFPMSLIEAEANRLPLLSFDVPTGPNEIIKDGENGFLLKQQDIDGMVLKIQELIENLELRKNMSNIAVQFSEEFTLDKIMQKWTKLIDVS